jgi:crossover junction endodeoxyribonuclease RuvC
MRIIAIDPGYDRAGVAILEKSPGRKEELLFSTCVVTDRKADFYDRIRQIQHDVEEVVKKYHPERLIMEELYFANNSPTALRVAEARGIVSGVAVQQGIPVSEIHPNHVKIAITGYGRAKKDDMLFMLSKLIDLGNDKKLDDEIDAIAVGIAYFAHEKTMKL